MKEIDKCYRKLGLSPGASLEEVEQAYRDLIEGWRPKRFGNDIPQKQMAEEKLREINYAYGALISSLKSVGRAQPSDAITTFTRATPDQIVNRADDVARHSMPKPALGASRRTAYLTVLVAAGLLASYFFFSGEGDMKSSNKNAVHVTGSLAGSQSLNSQQEAPAPISSKTVTEPIPPPTPTGSKNNESSLDANSNISSSTADSLDSPHDPDPPREQDSAHPELHLPEITLNHNLPNTSSNFEMLVDHVLKERSSEPKRRHKRQSGPEPAQY